MLIATAVAAALSLPVGAMAASSDELTQIREQLQGLMQRVDKLEQQNTELKTENDSLKSQTDYLKAEAKGLRKDTANMAVDVNKTKGTDWASRVSLKGDLRYRYEWISDDAVNAAGIQTADRNRDRIRARFNVEAKATDTILVGLGFTTDEGGDPRSGNQTLTKEFSRKGLDLDLAYFDWKFADWGDLIGGKMKQPFYKQPQSMFWDNDVNPEGLALTFNNGMWFGSGYYYYVNEVSGLQNTTTSDTSMAGIQIGARVPIGQSQLVLAAHYYDLMAGQRHSPFFGGSSNGNTTTTVVTAPGPPPVTTQLLTYDFNVINLTAEFNTTLGNLPLQIWADVAENEDPSNFNQAWSGGVWLGKASNYRTFEIGAGYHHIEKDSLFAQFIDSDFGGGISDTEGWAFKAAYAPLKNWTLNATYFLNDRYVDVPLMASPTSAPQSSVGYDRLQLDFSLKF